jgi:N-acetylglucosamine kinase-like BadF-type ATPase
VTGGRRLVLAIDGGNTKTVAAVADRDGRVLAAARGGASDIYARGGVEGALEVLLGVARGALASAGAAASDLGANVWSLAGADWPEDFALLERELAAQLGTPSAPIVVNDAFGGLRSGAPDNVGIAIVCGTFNAICARSREGRTFHLGFWPDRVGGFDLGLAALNAVYRHGLDLGPATRLTECALALFGVDDTTALMHAFTRREDRVPLFHVQRLAPVLLDLAEAGDAVARDLVREGGLRLGAQARVSAARVGLSVPGARVVLSGGVLQHPTKLLASAILEPLPGGVPVRPTAPPVVGALLLGFDALGAAMDADALAASLAERRTSEAPA